jgi:hypothetical protein
MDCIISREELLDSEVLEEDDIEMLIELHSQFSTVTDAHTATGLDS